MRKQYLLIACLFTIITSAIAQTTDTTTPTNKTQFKLSLNYNSGLNYYGRTDSLNSKGVFPMAEIWFTPNFYINAAPIFVHNKVQSMEYAGSVATLGYLYTSDKWLSNLYVLKPFYKESSDLVQSALKAQAGASFSFLSKAVNITAGGDVKYSDKLDYGAMAGLDHIIRYQAKNNGVFVADPSVYVYAGTQNFSRTYKRKTGGILLPREQQVTENVQQFNVLSFEASVPLIYAKDKFQVMVTPAYVVPKNLLTVANRPDQSENGKKMFYTTASIKYTL